MANFNAGAFEASRAHSPDPFISTPAHPDLRRQRYSSYDMNLSTLYADGSPSQARRALEKHLAETERRLQEASAVGQALVSQREELAKRLKEVERQQEDTEIDPELRQRLRDLEREFHEVGKETSRVFIPKAQGSRVSSAEYGQEGPVYEREAQHSPTKVTAPSHRKQRNQAPSRLNDIKLATEISSSLLNQLRELQAALAEKDDALKAAQHEQAQLEVEVEGLHQRIRAMDESEQRYKDENWSLETQIQEMMASQRQAAEREQKLIQQLNSTKTERTTIERDFEELKSAHGKLSDDHEAARKTADTQLQELRRDVSTAEAERTHMQRKVDELQNKNQELAKAVAYRVQAAQQAQDADLPSDLDDDEVGRVTPQHSPPPSPSKATPRHGHLETETLKSSLHHAQRMIQNLKNHIHREKTEKLELKRMLQDTREELEKRKSNDGPGSAAKKRKTVIDKDGFKKPPRPDRLGAMRAPQDIIMDDDWEDQEDGNAVRQREEPPRSPRTSRWTVPGATAEAAHETTTEGSDAFDTANERDTATETEAFQTGAETLDGNSDEELTETENNFTDASHSRAAPRPSPLGRHTSFRSTASTSASDDEDRLRTPIQPNFGQQPRYRLKINRSRYNRRSLVEPEPYNTPPPVSRENSDVNTSFISIGSNNSTPAGAGQNLAAELANLSDDDASEAGTEGTPSRSRIMSREVSPELRRSMMSTGTVEFNDLPISTPAKSAMVDSAMMTEAWEPESKGVLATAGALGAALVGGIGLGRSGNDAGTDGHIDTKREDRPSTAVQEESLVPTLGFSGVGTQHTEPQDQEGPSLDFAPVHVQHSAPINTDFDEVQRLSDQLSSQSHAHKVAVLALQREVDEHRANATTTAARLSDLQHTFAKTQNESEAHQTAVQALQRELEEYKANAITTAARLSSESEAHQTAMQGLQRELDEQKANSTATAARLSGQLSSESQAHHEAVQALQRELDQHKASATATAARLAELEQALAKTQDEVVPNLEQQLEEQKGIAETHKASLIQLDQERNRMHEEVVRGFQSQLKGHADAASANEVRLTALNKEQADAHKTAMNNLQKELDEQKALATASAALLVKLEEAYEHSQEEVVRTLQKEIDDQKAIAAADASRIAELTRTLEGMHSEDVVQGLREEIDGHKAIAASTASRVAELERINATMHPEETVQGLRDEISQQKAIISANAGRLAELERNIAAMYPEETVQSLRAEINEHRAINSANVERLAEVERIKATMHPEETVQSLREEISKHNAVISTNTERLAELERVQKTMYSQEVVQSLREEVNEQKAIAASNAARLAELERINEAMYPEEVVQSLRKAVDEHQSLAAANATRLSDLEFSRADILSQLEEARKARDIAQQALQQRFSLAHSSVVSQQVEPIVPAMEEKIELRWPDSPTLPDTNRHMMHLGAEAGSDRDSEDSAEFVKVSAPLGFSNITVQDVEPQLAVKPYTDSQAVAGASARHLSESSHPLPGSDAAKPGMGFFSSSLPWTKNSSAPSTVITEDAENQPEDREISSTDLSVKDRRVPFASVTGNARDRSPSPEKALASKPLRTKHIDEGTQTNLSSDEISKLVAKKERPASILVSAAAPTTNGFTTSAKSSSSPTRSHRGSKEFTNQPGSPRTVRRPGSQGSLRSRPSTPPPLPADHLRVIEAAAKAQPIPAPPVLVLPNSNITNGTATIMGPPLMPASAYRSSSIRSRAPVVPASPKSNSSATPRPKVGTVRSHSQQSITNRSLTNRSSMSSFASELDQRFNISNVGPGVYDPSTTDPRMIQAITQTMIGEYLWKYTRKVASADPSDTRHRRFFWIHPYTRTLYWSEKDPSSGSRSEMKSKSASIEAVRVVPDDNPMPPGLHRKSIIVVTPGRVIKFTATTGQRHETWFNALSYLLLRTAEEREDENPTATGSVTAEDVDEFNPRHQYGGATSRMTGRSRASLSSYNSRTTQQSAASPRRQDFAVPTLTQRTATRQHLAPSSPFKSSGTITKSTIGRVSGMFRGSIRGSFASRRSAQSIAQEAGEGSDIYQASVVDDSAEDLRQVIEFQERGADRLENVRACCDGKHDVGTLTKSGRHKHTHASHSHSHARQSSHHH